MAHGRRVKGSSTKEANVQASEAEAEANRVKLSLWQPGEVVARLIVADLGRPCLVGSGNQATGEARHSCFMAFSVDGFYHSFFSGNSGLMMRS
jgi:hypothetical protein